MFINFFKDVADGSLYTLEQDDLTFDGALSHLEEDSCRWSEYAYTVEISGDRSIYHNLAATLGDVIRNKIHEDPGLEDIWGEHLWDLDSASMRSAGIARAQHMVADAAA